MFHNCQNNQAVNHNHATHCCHVVANGTELVRGIAQPQRDLMGKRPSDSLWRSKQSATPMGSSESTEIIGAYSPTSMSDASMSMRVDTGDRMTRTRRAGDPPAAIWASLVMSRALSS